MLDFQQKYLKKLVNIICIPLRGDESLPKVLDYDYHLEVVPQLGPLQLVAEIFGIFEEVELNLADCWHEANLNRLIDILKVIVVFEGTFDEELFAYSFFPADLYDLGVLVQHAKQLLNLMVSSNHRLKREWSFNIIYEVYCVGVLFWFMIQNLLICLWGLVEEELRRCKFSCH